jgi:hypothetical protein
MKKTVSIILIFLSTFCYSQNDVVKEKIKDLNDLYGRRKFQKVEILSKEILNNQYGTPTNEDKCNVLALYTSLLIWDDYENRNYKLGYDYILDLSDLWKNGMNDFPLKDSNIVKINDLIKDLEKKHPELKTSVKENENNAVVEIKTETINKTTETTTTETTTPKSTSDDKTVTLTVSGSGKTLEEAKQIALRIAISQTFGAFISSKTELLNDNLITDQITSITNGNIQSFEILNEIQLPNGNWGTTIKAKVSINKLTSFVESKGIIAEIKGGLFALNIKQQILNEEGEEKAICDMVSLLNEPMQQAFDFDIKSSDPKSIDTESKNWVVPLKVTVKTNKNIDIIANYFIKTLSALSLTNLDAETYKNLNKSIYPVYAFYNNKQNTFYLRRSSSVKILETLISQWSFYTRLFVVDSGINEMTGLDIILNKNVNATIYNIEDIKSKYDRKDIYVNKESDSGYSEISIIKHNLESESMKFYYFHENNKANSFNFLNEGKVAAIYSWNDERNIAEIEKMTGYKVKPKGISSIYKNGGIVVYEKDGHGLIASLYDLGPFEWSEGKKACDDFNNNGYSDWYLPSKDELNLIRNKLIIYNIGGFDLNHYWSNTPYNNNYYFLRGDVVEMQGQPFGTEFPEGYNKEKSNKNIRAVRKF